ncbi:hypothetical protein [Paremcibacter congregatus]|uniref:Uncharacterized protein n=1 Tax=Paremcibacter congregatus TaxID=2043170 RepID=A0A2G4YSY1_9PROT|nr:hypothetical protein [Paremcibacter congregatus]PHZ85449.1 hypothetical protein CRD36_06755 [Paremcibacter congregatus]QDE27264.1 hypothetical protein FIV45_08190 [Paremcibacter congregatus]
MRPELKHSIQLVQVAIGEHPLFDNIPRDQQILALITLAAGLARSHSEELLANQSKNSRMKWADMTVRTLVPDLGNGESAQ